MESGAMKGGPVRGRELKIGLVASVVALLLGVVSASPAAASHAVDYYLGSDFSYQYSQVSLTLCQDYTVVQDIRSRATWSDTLTSSAEIDAYRFQNRDPGLQQQFQGGDWYGTNSQTRYTNSGWVDEYDWSSVLNVTNKRIYASGGWYGESVDIWSDDNWGAGGWHGARCTGVHTDSTSYYPNCSYNCW